MRELKSLSVVFDNKGWVVLPSFVHSDMVQKCLALIESTDASSWVSGDNSQTAWKELSCPNAFAFQRDIGLELIEEIVGRKIKHSVQWINVFYAGQVIPYHLDRDGDAQVMICIAVPNLEDGGQFWMYEEDHLLQLGATDALLFRAKTIKHGTTLVRRGTQGRRITLNIRLWFAEDNL